MKKIIITAFFFSLCTSIFSQTILVTNSSNTSTVSPNSVVSATTSANNTTGITFDIKNISASSQTYKVKRYDILLNSGATANFCFAGGCFPPTTTLAPTTLTLAAGQSASQLSGSYNELVTDLNEAPTTGTSTVKYTIYNTTNATDSIQFTISYNNAVSGINELNNSFSLINLYPNPSKDVTNLCVESANFTETSYTILNALGAVVYSKDVVLKTGKNKFTIETSGLNKGIYFVKIAKSTLKLIVD
ncbi:MAG: T9SS type A sorting domain-containing protein [Bacteroidetes bacterium]|nr:T9SS type A sorting domain-containing protein [Bacteroidota bacterium]